MPLPCKLPLSGSSSNPVSLPGAIASLSAQVTSTMLEVRQEIGELKCEFIQVRGLAIQLAASLIAEQTQRLKLEFEKTQSDEGMLILTVRLAASIIQQETQRLKDLFNRKIESQIETQSYQAVFCALAASIIRSQSQIFQAKTSVEANYQQSVASQFSEAIAIINLQTKIVEQELL
jgi:hypothetical protein